MCVTPYTYVQQNLTHKISFTLDFAAVVVHKIEDYVIEGGEKGNAAVVLIFICPNICEDMAV